MGAGAICEVGSVKKDLSKRSSKGSHKKEASPQTPSEKVKGVRQRGRLHSDEFTRGTLPNTAKQRGVARTRGQSISGKSISTSKATGPCGILPLSHWFTAAVAAGGG